VYCNGAETCVAGACEAGTDPCPDQVCDEDNDTCIEVCLTDADCDDDDPCTTDVCDAAGDCVNTPIECDPGETCVDGECVEIECTSDADCDDGFACTTNACNTATGECIFANVDALCHDGLFCTGSDGGDVCDPTDADAGADGCVRDGDPCGGDTPICDEADDECDPCGDDDDCDDGATCTTDNCEGSGACTNTPVDVLCDDDQFCTDDDFCNPDHDDADETTGCVNETDPCNCAHPSNPCGFGGVAGFLEERKLCNEADDTCDDCTGNEDCDDDILCTEDTCNGATGVCTNESNSDNCPDPDFCDGVDECDPMSVDADANGCVQPGNPCGGDTPICDEADDVCEACVSNAECDDGIDCTTDTCNGTTGACDNVDNCTLPEVCNLDTGECEVP
jgi:hypothetical protein